MNFSTPPSSPIRRLAVAVRGVVQGVGFRPFVYNLARANKLRGWIRNEADVVRLEVQGESAAVDDFIAALRNAPPPQSRIDELEIREISCEHLDETTAEQTASFQILSSFDSAAPGPTIPADLAVCEACLAEIRDPAERRFRYPFTNCTNCGPRWSIIERLPYDRPRTSMSGFAMCPECRAEYENPADRRFHAQPIACPRCGPRLELLDPQGRPLAAGDEAFAQAATAVLEGRVLALKGLGGFQLIVDATNSDAVARLRQRKRRPDRPFALMMSSLDQARQHCHVSEDEAKMLQSHRAPIVLLRKKLKENSPHPNPLPKGEGTGIADEIAPGNPCLGVMLPCTPLHYLLMDAVDRPVVCTSGNLSEDPMAISTEEAVERLGQIADLILTHNRPIVRPVDDSIVRLGPCGFQVLRRARGYAPLPISLPIAAPTILAVGGYLKNTVALSLCRVLCEHPLTPVIMSAHIGDLDNLPSVRVFRRAIEDLTNFFAVEPDLIACDLHPDYASTREAESLAARWNAPLIRVQHHHAHVAAAMAEHGLEGPVLGLAWDGTGLGTDGTIWGGEALLCEGAEFKRVAHLRTFSLPGGDRAASEPRRSALGVLHEIMGNDSATVLADYFSPAELNPLLNMLDHRSHCPRTSSMGRLFDAVAALCGLPAIISFEGQAAMSLEFAADENEEAAYPLPLVQGAAKGTVPFSPTRKSGQFLQGEVPFIADWEPMLRAVLADRAAGAPIGRISGKFHNALADLAVRIAQAAGVRQVVLTGGCFQNALLTKRVRHRLYKAGFLVYPHKEVPPGDGGIALGQIFVAARNKWLVASG